MPVASTDTIVGVCPRESGEERSDSTNNYATAVEDGVMSSNRSAATPQNVENERTWISTYAYVDQILSGSLLHLCYRILDIIILLLGLLSSADLCSRSNRLAVTSICLLIFYFIDLSIIAYYFIQNISSNYRRLSDMEKAEKLRRVAALRGFFIFFKLVPVCVGISYALTSNAPETNDCEVMRCCLGVVCISTLLIVVIPPTKPEVPTRRSFSVECFILLCMLLFNGTYFGTVASSMQSATYPSCIYHNTVDFYLGAPLKSYAYAGLVLFSCTTLLNIINVLVCQLCYRLTDGRRLYTHYYALQYLLSYLSSLTLIYYFSVGALFLFQPRSGGLCRADAPGLYKTLLIWQWIRILFPLLAVPLILILCCLGVFFGIILSYFLPASITVPLLELLRGWLSASPVQLNPNPPATQESIDALPIVLFGQEPDQFNQTECAICQTNFEANEPVKKLECAHLFHSECVANWLLITRICPVCRRRMSSVNQQ